MQTAKLITKVNNSEKKCCTLYNFNDKLITTI